MAANFDFYNLTEETFQKINRQLHGKIHAGIPLNAEETCLFCEFLKFQDLKDFPICEDEYFYRIFMEVERPLPMEWQRVGPRDIQNYHSMIKKWGMIISKSTQDVLLKLYLIESNREINALKAAFPIKRSASQKKQFDEKLNAALAWSKCRFIMIKNIWIIRMGSAPYNLELDGSKILFDQESLVHILCRHYAETMRAHPNDKSFFSRDLMHNNIPQDLEEIFCRLDYNRSFAGESLDSINIRWNGSIYRIYCNLRKGGLTSEEPRYRISTIFPVEKKQALQEIEQGYDEYLIYSDLSLFRKKQPAIKKPRL